MEIKILNEIAELEKTAETSIKKAEEKAENIILAAKEKAENDFKKLEQELKENHIKDIDKLEAKFAKKKKEELKITKDSVQALKKTSDKNTQKAINYIYSEFLK